MARTRVENGFRRQARQRMMRAVAGCGLLALLFATGCPIPEPTTRPAGKATASKRDRPGRKPDRAVGRPRRGSSQAMGSPRRQEGEPSGEKADLSTLPGRIHCVRPGETLFSITKTYYGDGKHWRKIFVANRHRIKDPGQLPVGMKLIIP